MLREISLRTSCRRYIMTFRTQVLGALQIVHGLEGLGLLAQEGLFVIVLARPAHTI